MRRIMLAIFLTAVATQLMIQTSGYRLPENVTPISYDVKLVTHVNTDFTYNGVVSIDVTVHENTNDIVLHSNNLKNLEVTVKQTNVIPTIFAESKDDKHFLTITPQAPVVSFAPGDYNIEIKFSGELTEDMYGFYKSSYVTPTNEVKWIAATQFQPTHARRVFPCFDEPAFKARFTIQLTVPPGYHALSNTPTETGYPQESPDIPTWEVYKFKQSGIMSSYLVAFIVSDFESLTDVEAKYSFTAWARQEAIGQAEYSQEVGPQLVDWFEKYTGIDYTFEKIDQVALPDFAAGAMENWGLITYRETGLLYYEEASTEANRKSLANVVAHELAHMWFGNLVTLNWWSDTWLNEGFARYFQYLSTSQVEQDWRLMEQFLVDQQHAIFGTDSLASAQALSSDCETPAQISAKFTSISYSKGGSILRMISHILTPETFQKALQKYLSDHQEDNTVPTDLFNALEYQRTVDNPEDQSVQDFLPLWTTQPGYPVITVTRESTTFTVSQERFLLKDDEAAPKYKWWVPLSWTKESDAPNGFDQTKAQAWLLDTQDSQDFVIEADDSEWVIFNNQETGYYRVNYDTDTWNLIIQSLHNNPEKIHVLNRAQLVDDALNLARAGKLDYTIALDVVDYLHNEEDYIPWVSALNALSFLNRKLISEEDHTYFKTYIHSIINELYSSLGFDVDPSDSHITHLHRASLLSWACGFDNIHCVQQATIKFNDYKTDQSKLVNANLRSVVYCTALRTGGEDEWNFLWNIYLDSRIAVEKVVILSALGCTENEDLLRGYLEKSIDQDSGIRKQDAASVFSAVYSNPKGIEVAFDFLTNRYSDIATYYGGMNAISNILTGIAGRLTTEDQVSKLEEFITNNADQLGSAAEAGRNAVESAKADMAWTETHKEAILNWYKDKVSTSTVPPTSEPTPPVTEPTPPVTEPTPPVTEPTPPVTEPSTSPTSQPTTDAASTLSHNLIIVLTCIFIRLLLN